jgi:hypothetical protein
MNIPQRINLKRDIDFDTLLDPYKNTLIKSIHSDQRDID